MHSPAYPETRYTPVQPVNLASKDERARLSVSALKAFFRLAARWDLRDEDAKQLLGGVTNGPYYEMKKHPDRRVLGPDTLLRISYLLGIFKALNVLHHRTLADEWVSLPNSNRIFGGGTPLAYMIHGGLPAMSTVRRLLDARQVGL
jgi:hypothetical protein